MRCLLAKQSRPGSLAPEICASLTYSITVCNKNLPMTVNINCVFKVTPYDPPLLDISTDNRSLK